MDEKFNANKYKNDFNKQKYDRVTVMFPKGRKDEIAVHAKSNKESINAFINRAVQAQIERDNAQED